MNRRLADWFFTSPPHRITWVSADRIRQERAGAARRRRSGPNGWRYEALDVVLGSLWFIGLGALLAGTIGLLP